MQPSDVQTAMEIDLCCICWCVLKRNCCTTSNGKTSSSGEWEWSCLGLLKVLLTHVLYQDNEIPGQNSLLSVAGPRFEGGTRLIRFGDCWWINKGLGMYWVVRGTNSANAIKVFCKQTRAGCLLANLCWQSADEMQALVLCSTRCKETPWHISSTLSSSVLHHALELCVCWAGRIARKFVHNYRRFSIVYETKMSGQLDAPTAVSPDNDLWLNLELGVFQNCTGNLESRRICCSYWWSTHNSSVVHRIAFSLYQLSLYVRIVI